MFLNHVELHFPLRGITTPRNHDYALDGAIGRAVPELHGVDRRNVCGIGAKMRGPGALALQR